MYAQGYGVTQDYSQAKNYYTKSCDLDNGLGCSNLGRMYQKGEGVRYNKTTAKEFFGKACDLGFQDGCNNYKILSK